MIAKLFRQKAASIGLDISNVSVDVSVGLPIGTCTLSIQQWLYKILFTVWFTLFTLLVSPRQSWIAAVLVARVMLNTAKQCWARTKNTKRTKTCILVPKILSRSGSSRFRFQYQNGTKLVPSTLNIYQSNFATNQFWQLVCVTKPVHASIQFVICIQPYNTLLQMSWQDSWFYLQLTW